MTSSQSSAQVCKRNYEEGNRQTEIAKEQYDKDVEEGYRRKAQWESENGAGTYTLTINPFQDPGRELRDKAVSDFASLISELEKHAAATASEVRASCDGADAARNWLESGLAFLGGIVVGAVEAVVDIASLLLSIQYGPFVDLYKILTGELTLEEWAEKSRIPFDTAAQAFKAFAEDPISFGAVLDVDTWKDDPARALGHLVPDVLAAVFSGGSSAAVTRGAKIADDVSDVGDVARAADRAGDVAEATGDISRGAKASEVQHLDDIDLSMGKAVEHPGGFEGWLKDFSAKNPDASPEAIEAVHRYTGNDYDAINSALRGSGGIPTSVNDTIRNAEKVFDQLPASPGKTLRGTTLPQEVWDNMSRTGKFSDPAFLSTSTDPQVAKNFLESSRKLAPYEIPVTLGGLFMGGVCQKR